MTRHLSADNDAIGTFETCRYVRDLVASLIGRLGSSTFHNADAGVLDRNVQSSKMLHAALLLLMLEARSHGDLVSPSA